jgi:glucose-6-phosphate isomerase
VPHKVLNYRDVILRESTFEQRYRYVQIYTVAIFFMRGWFGGRFFTTVGLGTLYFAPELFSPFYRNKDTKRNEEYSKE